MRATRATVERTARVVLWSAASIALALIGHGLDRRLAAPLPSPVYKSLSASFQSAAPFSNLYSSPKPAGPGATRLLPVGKRSQTLKSLGYDPSDSKAQKAISEPGTGFLPPRPAGSGPPIRTFQSVAPSPPIPPSSSPHAGSPLGGRLWTHIDRPDRHRLKFRMYQFNPTGSDGKGTGWYHEGDFTEWLTEMLHYEIRGDEVTLGFDLAGERALVRYRVEKGRGPDGEDLKLTFLPDPRRYWKPYEYFAHSRQRAGDAEILATFSKLGP